VRAVAAEVKGHGAKYEEILKERERGNPKFAFLLHKNVRNGIQFLFCNRRRFLFRSIEDMLIIKDSCKRKTGLSQSSMMK
jgi:hypothetical protein